MRKITKKSFFIKFLVIPIIVTILIVIANYLYYWWYFMRISNIQMIYFDSIPCKLKIPVRYVNRECSNINATPIHTEKRWTYFLVKGSPTKGTYITISRWGLFGFTVYTAKYEIIDSKVKEKLLKL